MSVIKRNQAYAILTVCALEYCTKPSQAVLNRLQLLGQAMQFAAKL